MYRMTKRPREEDVSYIIDYKNCLAKFNMHMPIRSVHIVCFAYRYAALCIVHRAFCNFAAFTLPIHNGHNAELFKSSLLRIIMCGVLVVINFAHMSIYAVSCCREWQILQVLRL